MITNLPFGSVTDELSMNGMFLFGKFETPLCLLLYVDEYILSNSFNLRCWSSLTAKCFL